MTNQIVLGTIHDKRLCAIHRADSDGGEWPVKYWVNGPDEWGTSGWFFYDDGKGDNEGFNLHPFDGEPFDYPVISAFDPVYNSVILLVVVADYELHGGETAVPVKAATPEMLHKFVTK